MYNLFYSLPNELIRKIYEYDTTYKEEFKDVLKFIDEMEICTCSGRHPSEKLSFNDRVLYCYHCPMHRPRYRLYESSLSIKSILRNSESYNFESWESLYNDEENISSNNVISRMFIPQKSIQIINTKKIRQGRFMDMRHYQRRKV